MTLYDLSYKKYMKLYYINKTNHFMRQCSK